MTNFFCCRLNEAKLEATGSTRQDVGQPSQTADQVQKELESLTFEPTLSTAANGLDQIFLVKPAVAADKSTLNGEDLRKTSSQNYQSNILNDVFNRASNVSASTQETAPQAKPQGQLTTMADGFSTGKQSTDSQPSGLAPAFLSGQNPFASCQVSPLYSCRNAQAQHFFPFSNTNDAFNSYNSGGSSFNFLTNNSQK